MASPLEMYLTELAAIRSSGAGLPEISYYPPLAKLFDAVGSQLSPRVRCLIQLKNSGAGLPDGGFFTLEQLRPDAAVGASEQVPARGALEVKPASADAFTIAGTPQVVRYCARYGQVLVTNLRDFVLVGADETGQPAVLESYRLARDEETFWEALRAPHAAAATHARALDEYLKRVLLHAPALIEARDLAWFLASYARDALARIESVPLTALDGVRGALEEALGLRFEGAKGERFFRSSLVQTLFYGLFAAWAIRARRPPGTADARFDWRLAAHELRVPVLRKLFHELADPGQLDLLRLSEVLTWAGAALNRVDRRALLGSFVGEHTVQYFYEPFLEAYDPQLRKELGVWYTPPEIVRYMVARVDRVLRDEMGIADGLADPRVHVLDPAAGTGSFLVEVLRCVHATHAAKDGPALAPSLTKQAALARVAGFEILPAPFVVAHLQIGMLLQELGAPLSERIERPAVYLTNALTGWEASPDGAARLLFPELQEERDLARRVKQDAPILVVLGNPPYNAFAGVSPAEEEGLVAPYKRGLGSDWGIHKYNLDELYVRFLRVAERRIAEMSGRGVIAFISSYSYLSDPSFVVLRERLLREFDALWFDCLNGDSRETGKRTPDGGPDPSVFSSDYNRAGIKLGTVIGVMVRKPTRGRRPMVRYRDFWGTRKREDLEASVAVPAFDKQYMKVRPQAAMRFSFRHHAAALDAYQSWPRVVELCAEAPISGLQEMRRGDLMAIDRAVLERRMEAYFDRGATWSSLEALAPGLTRKAGAFVPEAARERLLALGERYESTALRRYALYPLDVRWCYHSRTSPLWNRPRPRLTRQAWPGNRFLVVRQFAERPHEHVPLTVTSALPDYHLLRPNAVAIPFEWRDADEPERRGQNGRLFDSPTAARANLSSAARAWLTGLGLARQLDDSEAARLVWLHVLAVAHAPAYLRETAGAAQRDWPRIPLPAALTALRASARLGVDVADLVDAERDVSPVTTATARPELRPLARPLRLDGRPLDPLRGDLRVLAGWGHGGARGVVMPGRGRMLQRTWSSTETQALASGAALLGLDVGTAQAQLGSMTFDVHLNDDVVWGHVPEGVWRYTIGGYQVLKKWLSYRETDVLGRELTLDELREFTGLARRLAALLLLQPALDRNYAAIKGEATSWRPTTHP